MEYEERNRKKEAKEIAVLEVLEKMKEAEGSLDLILNTISGNHDISSYLSLLVTLTSHLSPLSHLSPGAGRYGSLCSARSGSAASLCQPGPAPGEESHALWLSTGGNEEHSEAGGLLCGT